MSNVNQEEALEKEYDSVLMRRLLKYAFPYKWLIAVVVAIMFVLVSLDLSIPLIIQRVIDNNLTVVNGEYSIVSNYVDGCVELDDNVYAVRGKADNGKEATLVSYENNKYYMVDGTIDKKSSYDIQDQQFKQGDKIVKCYLLSGEEIKTLRADDLHAVKFAAAVVLAICVVMFVFNYLQVYILQYTGQKIIYTIRQDIFKHVESLSLSFFDNNAVGRLVTRVTNDVENLNEMYTEVVVYFAKDLFIVAGIIIAMFILDVKLAVISIITLPVVLILTFVFRKYDREAYRKVRARLSKINSVLSENITGMKTIQIYGVEDKKYRQFDEINKSYYNATLGQIKVFAIFRPIMNMMYQLALCILIWAGGKAVINLTLEFGVLYAFITYIRKLYEPIFDLSEKFDILQSAMASAERIFNLMDNKSIIENPKEPKHLKKVEGNIEFNHVWFAYNNEDWVLKDVSFKINKGETVAFVGATGAGKTSIISLLTRLYDIQKGEILIDGINIKDMDKSELRNNVSTVLQDVFLFTGDIKGNVKLNNDSITDRQVIEACRYVNADTFIEKLPDKYDSKVNERGTTFSQGERQLIAFARAIAFNPPILVLDEATANIDTETEVLIQDALSKLTKGRTTIVVAHRLSTIRNADKIIVMHKGRIREMGTHSELIEKNGLYSNLYKLQCYGAN